MVRLATDLVYTSLRVKCDGQVIGDDSLMTVRRRRFTSKWLGTVRMGEASLIEGNTNSGS